MAMAPCTRSAARLFRPSASSAPTPLRVRGFASDNHGHESLKVNMWDAPLKPALWKEEHFVLTSLAGWGLLIYGGYKAFSGGKKEPKKE